MPWRRRVAVDRRQFVAGLLFGLACTARLSIVFGAPFFAFVGAGAGWRGAPGRPGWARRCRSWPCSPTTSSRPASSSARLRPPVPARDGRLPGARLSRRLGHRGRRATCPRTSALALFGAPDLLPDAAAGRARAHAGPGLHGPGAVRGLFDVGCPLAVPRDTGMSVLLTSPAYLARDPGARRASAGAGS